MQKQEKDLLPLSHYIHSGYNHKVTRGWMKKQPRIQNLVYPVFVLDKAEEEQQIQTIPGIKRYGYQSIVKHLEPLVAQGLKSILIFGILCNDKDKDEIGSHAGTPDMLEGPTHKGIRSIKKAFPEILIITDVCLCAFTTHGHCGVINKNGLLDNDASNKRIGEVALSYVKAGADMVAPSDMMDGRIAVIKKLLLNQGLEIPIMSYSAKFASSLYGPFRDICSSAPKNFDRQGYQLPIDSLELALKAVQRDIEEGADFIMVKPISAYLDIAREIKNTFQPVMACYHVSGEYAMIYFAAQAGACDKQQVVLEFCRSFVRAGIDIIITYFTPQLLDWLQEN